MYCPCTPNVALQALQELAGIALEGVGQLTPSPRHHYSWPFSPLPNLANKLPAGFRDFPLGDLPMLEVLRQASEGVFVPLTVGGGIREFTDASGKHYSALQVAAEYFRCVGGGRGAGAQEAGRGASHTSTFWGNKSCPRCLPCPAPAQVWR